MLRTGALICFVLLTNHGFWQRLSVLYDQERWGTLAWFIVIWAACIGALATAALQPNCVVRAGWAAVIATTTAVGFTFRHASGTEFGVFDAVSLWNARHEAGRALDFYSAELGWFSLVFACGLLVIALPPAPRRGQIRRLLARAAPLPLVPVAAIAGIIHIKEGGGSQALPAQFAPLAVGLISGATLVSAGTPERRPVGWIPGAAKARRIVLIVDESVRADYLDWRPGNPFTPEIAALGARIVNFGPAVSGGNCSHYSNALLRFAAARSDVGGRILSNPTIWQYAKAAGFRTVFMDSQSAYVKNPGKLQNFMTPEELRHIDVFFTIEAGVPSHALDEMLLDRIIAELRSNDPVFIYATKNGAHFPYDAGYPQAERVFRPTMAEGPGEPGARINSYRNVIRWSVDRFLKRLFDGANLDETVLVYTSDHGQAFGEDRLTHCTVEDPDPREALVPLFVSTGNAALEARFAAAAAASRGHVSHFSLAPTVLELLGYAPDELRTAFTESLLEPSTLPPAFTTGDVFGLFSSVRWHKIDLGKDYLEPALAHSFGSGRIGRAGETFGLLPDRQPAE